MAKAAEKPSLAEMVANATGKDLDDIDARITDLQAEIADRQKEIDGLKLIRKSIDWRLHGKPKRKQAQRKPKPTVEAKGDEGDKGDTQMRERIYDLISREGTLPVAAIAQRLGVRAAAVGTSIHFCDWFERLPNGDIAIAQTK
jgi:hypothetical protein